jgi:hypothetical protein
MKRETGRKWATAVWLSAVGIRVVGIALTALLTLSSECVAQQNYRPSGGG